MNLRYSSAILAVAALSLTTLSAVAESVRVRGEVGSLDGSKLVVHAKDGKDINVALADTVNVVAVVKASLSDVKPGVFIGTATKDRADSSLQSLEVVVFPDAMKGSGEGHYPWDLPGSSKMTNATVASAVKEVDGQTIKVTYKGGEKTIHITDSVPVVTFVPATAADLKPGAPVFVPGMREANSGITAGVVVVGKDGLAPPM